MESVQMEGEVDEANKVQPIKMGSVVLEKPNRKMFFKVQLFTGLTINSVHLAA